MPRLRTLIMFAVLSGCLGVLPAPPPVVAADLTGTENQLAAVESTTSDKDDDPDGPVKFLGSNDPSYFVLASERGEPGTHIEFFLSIQYPLLKEPLDAFTDKQWRLYFNYNGKYDFFVNSRDSSPIISRLQNPGLLMEYRPQHLFCDSLVAIRTGYFHESNGQTIDTNAEYQNTAHARDYVSRGWDYLPLELEFSKPLPASSLFRDFFKGFYLTFRGRYFLPKQMFTNTKEDEIFWENRETQPRIEDYDGLRLQFSKTYHPQEPWLPSEVTLKAHFRSGYHDYNLSQRYEVTTRVWGIPLYLFYFDGYGTNISTYQQKGSSFGGGFEFR